MLHKAWNSKEEMPYCFLRSFIKFQGDTEQNITDFDPNWAFPDYRPVAAFKSLRFALFMHLSGVSELTHWPLEDVAVIFKLITGFLLGWNFFRTICPGGQRSTGHLQFLQDNFSWTINWNLKVRLIVVRKHSTLMAKSGNVLHSLLSTQPMLCLEDLISSCPFY